MKETKVKLELRQEWGGESNWYNDSKRWANKQVFPVNHIALGFIEWVWERWVDAQVKDAMMQVDAQVEQIVDQWEEEDHKPEIIVTPSEVEGLDTIEIKSPWQRK